MSENGRLTEVEALIKAKNERTPKINPVLLYLISKLLPLLLLIIFLIFRLKDSEISILLIVSFLLEFYITKSISGLQLVGLKWSIDFQMKRISTYSKPEPFIPKISESNIFWIGFFISTFIWFSFFVGLFFFKRPLLAFVCGGGGALQIINFVLFKHAHNATSRKLQDEFDIFDNEGESVRFELIPENKENTDQL